MEDTNILVGNHLTFHVDELFLGAHEAILCVYDTLGSVIHRPGIYVRYHRSTKETRKTRRYIWLALVCKNVLGPLQYFNPGRLSHYCVLLGNIKIIIGHSEVLTESCAGRNDSRRELRCNVR